MGSFDKLLKPAAVAGATALGGPVGGALAGFGTTALTGGDFGESLTGGLSGGAGAALGGAGGSAGASGSSAAAPSFGSKFMTNLGFGKDPWQNISTGGNLVLSARNTMPTPNDPFGLLLPAPQRPRLLDVLNERSY